MPQPQLSPGQPARPPAPGDCQPRRPAQSAATPTRHHWGLLLLVSLPLALAAHHRPLAAAFLAPWPPNPAAPAIRNQVASATLAEPLANVTDLLPLINIGGIGAVLFWFMTRNEKSMKDVRQTLNEFRDASERASRVLLIHTMALPSAPPNVRAAAEQELHELDEVRRERAAIARAAASRTGRGEGDD